VPAVGRNLDVDLALAQLRERLVQRFGQAVPRGVLEDMVTVFSARFRDARIADFVPVLTERLCVAHLRELTGGKAADVDSRGKGEAS